MKLLLLALALFGTPALAEPLSPADRTALQALAEAADAAWNDKDAPRMASLYTTGASLRLSGGRPIESRAAIQGQFERNFAERRGEFRHITRMDHAELIDPSFALTDASVRVEQKQADGSWKLMRAFNNVTIARREGSEWKLQSVRAFLVPNPGER